MRVPRKLLLSGAACVLAGVVFFTEPCSAGITGSRHDWGTGGPKPVGSLLTYGSCSVCHLPHRGEAGSRLWSRSLSDERGIGKYVQTSAPDYLPGGTLLCYDCHDDGTWADESPDPTIWQTGYGPQDIALGGSNVGYYELITGAVPNNDAPTDGSPTGGHYWKSEPDGSQVVGDKLACSFCHDVHNAVTGTNMVLFRTTAVDSQDLGNGHEASENTRSGFEKTGINSGRSMCAACHAYSDGGVPKVFYGVDLADIRPPTSVVQHSNLNTTTACTNCHLHNRIKATCSDCHGYPPTSGAHQRHKDALGSSFNCAICHGPDPGGASWHNDGTIPIIAAEVDVMGQTSWWGPGGNYTGVDGNETKPDGYTFEKKGGGRMVCSNLACHGYPPGPTSEPNEVNWDDDMVNDGTGEATADINVCYWCHDSTPAFLDKDGDGEVDAGEVAPNVMGNETSWGANVNGHGKTSGQYDANTVGGGLGVNAANKACTVCHDATYTAGTHNNGSYIPGYANKPHFDSSYASAQKRLNVSINGKTLSTVIPPDGAISDATCIACHQYGVGTQVSSHGNHFNGSVETAFQRECRACHEPHGRNWNGSGRNLHMIGTWLDSHTNGSWGAADSGEEARVDSNVTAGVAVQITVADAKVIFTAATGENSYDDGFDDSVNPPESVCVVCHVDLVNNHNEAGDTTKLRGQGHNPVGSDCVTCHPHEADVSVATYDAFAPMGGPDIEQFFDAASSASNYDDLSGSAHALKQDALSWPEPPDCIGCHQTTGGSGVSNECLKCHYEGWLNGSSWTWVGHTNGSLELRSTLTATDPPYGAACNPGSNCIRIPKHVSGSTNVNIGDSDDVYTHCLACHDVASPAAKHQLGAQNPPYIFSLSGATWTAGMGHGNDSSLSSERTNSGGPPRYDCGACHFSTWPVSAGAPVPGYHASVNKKLVANTATAVPPSSYPPTADEYADAAKKNTWCLTQCHRTDGGSDVKGNNPTNSIAKDDNVIDHTWAPDASPSETAYQEDCPIGDVDPNGVLCETHPSYKTITVGDFYKLPTGLLPIESGNYFICVTCHEPHGNSTATQGQMIRMNYNGVGGLCAACHK